MAHADVLQRALNDAEKVAALAYEKWRRSPTGTRGPYWMKCWTEATQNIVKITRGLRLEGAEPQTLDQELSELLKP